MEQNLERRPNVSSLIKSIDGGGLWSSNFVCFREDDYYGAFLNQMFFIDNVGYILTSGHGSNHPEIVNGVYVYTIHKSVDYGNTWDTIAEFEQHWSPPKDEIINIVERPSALFFSTIDSGAIYLEESKVSTKDGFETSTKAENNGGDYLNISKDHTNTLFQKTESIVQHPTIFPMSSPIILP